MWVSPAFSFSANPKSATCADGKYFGVQNLHRGADKHGGAMGSWHERCPALRAPTAPFPVGHGQYVHAVFWLAGHTVGLSYTRRRPVPYLGGVAVRRGAVGPQQDVGCVGEDRADPRDGQCAVGRLGLVGEHLVRTWAPVLTKVGTLAGGCDRWTWGTPSPAPCGSHRTPSWCPAIPSLLGTGGLPCVEDQLWRQRYQRTPLAPVC